MMRFLWTTLTLWSVASPQIAVPTSSSTNWLAQAQEEVPDTYCLTMHDDLMRRQATEWGSTGPFTIEDGTKHTPFVTFDPQTRKATVIVGNGNEVGGVYHPMVASDNPTTVHFITHIYAVDQHHQLFAFQTMDPTLPAPATASFDVPEDVTEMTAYEFCNLHGLWRSNSISTFGDNSGQVVLQDSSSSNVTTSSAAKASDEQDLTTLLYMCDIDSPSTVAYDSFAADFARRQSLPPFNSLQPYTEEDGTKHVPYTTINGNGTATVTVGTPGDYHVMFGIDAATGTVVADDGYDANSDNEPHWITDIYVVDQNGDLVVMQSLNPNDMEIAQITFDIPSSATTLTAYEWCNIHGLYLGPTVSVETGDRVNVAPPSPVGGQEFVESVPGTVTGGESSASSVLNGLLSLVVLATVMMGVAMIGM